MNMLTGKTIRALRLKLGMTGIELANKLGVTENAVRRWEMEDRHPRWETMEKLNELADKAGIDLKELVA
jgi:transcriptional regulator with XRE-family HTH domain